MKKLYFLLMTGVLCVATVSTTQAASTAITSNLDPAFGASGTVEIVATIDAPDPSGIAVVNNRLFLTFPKHDGDHPGPVLAEWKNGQLIPFPSSAFSESAQGDPASRLISPHGMTTDTQGNIWVIDDGKIKGHSIPAGGAKVVGISPTSGQIIASVILKEALLPDSHMNDLRVDLTHGAKGTAFITDSSFGGHPALVVVDIATGRQRRVLAGHVSTMPDKGYQTVLDGRVLHYDSTHPTFPAGGADGITLSVNSQTLYYSPLASRRLYSLSTAQLADFSVSSDELAQRVVDEGEKGAADGLATDPWNRIYTTAADHDAIFRRNPDGGFELIASDPRFVWPDGIFADSRYVYVVLGQWSRLPRLHGGQDMRRPPFLVAKVPITPPASQ
ncbi:SMP-30/gluconolactonase/LRE family protein [Acetobacter sp.]|uniref:SMP-30/gluconolactonase/LRE family protein n=1 Tax=Acetobacter sp. TaxID=440 RepID=UPI0025B8FE44|nr:L-dopachrome tautomerase-related protein [Acetobacter sp.]MCH4091224.1 major royal jelly family protein [Acetobacter sp.]MCI1300881.1 major royal jelly family protein [Acetobacter sp.]MCI1317209.1 major royal jelly family protein [Acetobacter sp.]